MTPLGMREPAEGRNIPVRPRAGGEQPWLHPGREQTDVISPPDARGELGMREGSQPGPGQLGTAPSCAF